MFFKKRIKQAVVGASRIFSDKRTKSGKLLQGYIDEITATRVTGWARNGLNAHERIVVEIILALPEGDRVIGQTRAEMIYPPLSDSDFGDGKYGFDFVFETHLTAREIRHMIVRPLGSNTPLERAYVFQGFVDQRSTHHVAGWARNRFDPEERVQVEAVLATPDGEKILARGIANGFYPGLADQSFGDALNGFSLLYEEPVDDAAREQVFVRPAGATPLALSPNLVTNFEWFSHVAMDIVNNCNLRCPFCLFDYTDTNATRFMPEEVFESAIRLAPLVANGGLWLSCLHEPSLHPRFLEFIERVPRKWRRKLTFTTNLAKRMPASYFEALAASGVDHINISIESLDPPVYEKFRKGARWSIFKENWDRMIAAWRTAPAPPNLRYVTMAYQSNFREIPALIKYLIEDRLSSQIDVRYTYDHDHIPKYFRATEYLRAADWHWLSEQLAGYSSAQLLLSPPPDLPALAPAQAPATPPKAMTARLVAELPILPLNAHVKWDGSMEIYDKWEYPSEPTRELVRTNVQNLRDPFAYVQSLAASPAPDLIYGFVDEISLTSVTGWARNFSKPAEPVEFDVILVFGDETRIIGHGKASEHYPPLASSGFDNLNYGFNVAFDAPITLEQCDQLEVRPLNSVTSLRRATKYQGEVEARSQHHVSGWIRHRFNTSERVVFEVATVTAGRERMLGQGIADVYNVKLSKDAPGDPNHGFHMDFEAPLTETERDHLIVRPVNRRSIELALSVRLARELPLA